MTTWEIFSFDFHLVYTTYGLASTYSSLLVILQLFGYFLAYMIKL